LLPAAVVLGRVGRFLGLCTVLRRLRRGVDPLPDQTRHLLCARPQQWPGAEDQPISGKLDRLLLVAADPVGEQRQLHVMHDPVAVEAVAARVSDNALQALLH
jgi:hypothetical protein